MTVSPTRTVWIVADWVVDWLVTVLVCCCSVCVVRATLFKRQLPFESTVDSPSVTRNVKRPVCRFGCDAVFTTMRSG